MERLTYREYRLRLAWLEKQWNEPSRTDYYLMRIAQLLDALLRKGTRGAMIKALYDFRILFVRKAAKGSSDKDVRSQKEGEQRAEQSRTMWGTLLGGWKRGN
jgi:hypothetical protein